VARIELNEQVRGTAIALRRAQRVKLPDAIVVATALTLNCELITNDQQLSKVQGLRCRSLALK
jgi:predicted nucleic acid-binding protein